jgi:hypothetical protein
MAKAVPFFSNDELFFESYLLCIKQAMFMSEQDFDGTQRFELPVSKTTVECAERERSVFQLCELSKMILVGFEFTTVTHP